MYRLSLQCSRFKHGAFHRKLSMHVTVLKALTLLCNMQMLAARVAAANLAQIYSLDLQNFDFRQAGLLAGPDGLLLWLLS